MTAIAEPRRAGRDAGRTALTGAAAFWLLIALIGQWAFGYYLTAFYGANLLRGDFEAWSVLKKLGGVGYVPGDLAGNLTFGIHALAAGLIAFGGGLQLIPQVRTRWPRFHRWNGRVFLMTVTGLSLSGFYLVWGRHSSPSQLNAVGTTLNGVLILSFAALAWRTAVARRFDVHRRWALRLYLVSNGQWFLRIGLFAYFIASMGVGHKVSFSDPFLRFWVFGCYLAPLAVLELYLRARDAAPAWRRRLLAGSLVALTLLMGVGAAGFSMFSLRILSGAPLSLPK